MATKPEQIKKKRTVVLKPKRVQFVETPEVHVPVAVGDDEAGEGPAGKRPPRRPVLPQALQTAHFFDAGQAESREPPPPPPRQSGREVPGVPTFKFFCCRCGQKLQVPVGWANKLHQCRSCGHDIVIPPPLTEKG
jgi:hypothetical protein